MTWSYTAARTLCLLTRPFDKKTSESTNPTTGEHFAIYESRLPWRIEHQLNRLLDRLHKQDADE